MRNWGYDNGGAYTERVNCFVRLYDNLVNLGERNYSLLTLDENMADVSGMQLMMAAMRNEDCYRPDAPSHEGSFTEQQIYLMASCRLLCVKKKFIDDYTASAHPRRDHRCNVVLGQIPEFRSTFGCPPRRAPPCSILN